MFGASLLLILFSLPEVMSLDLGGSGARYARNNHELSSIPMVAAPELSKRVPLSDPADIKSFRDTLISKMEAHLPTKSGQSPSLLEYTSKQVTKGVCAAGQSHMQRYGSAWTKMPGQKLLGYMLADCARSMDKMDQVLLSYYTQDEIDNNPQAILFLKFSGIMYCNRLIAPLAVDSASLATICGLVS